MVCPTHQGDTSICQVDQLDSETDLDVSTNVVATCRLPIRGLLFFVCATGQTCDIIVYS